MKRIILLTAFMLAGIVTGTLFSQTPPTADKPKDDPKPTISAEIRAKFYKAQVELLNAQRAVDQKTQAMQQVVGEINAVCGEKFIPNLDQAGDLQCVPRPTPPKVEEPKK